MKESNETISIHFENNSFRNKSMHGYAYIYYPTQDRIPVERLNHLDTQCPNNHK